MWLCCDNSLSGWGEKFVYVNVIKLFVSVFL